MQETWTRENVIAFIKKELLLERLDLAGTGTSLEDIQEDTVLLHEGLGLDSVDALDLLVEVEKVFSLKLPSLSGSFIAEVCTNVGGLADYILMARAQALAASVPQPAGAA